MQCNSIIKALTLLLGTWQFMSATLIKDNRAHQTFVDDLESFCYVILWLVLMYLSNSMSPPNLTSFIQWSIKALVVTPKQFF